MASITLGRFGGGGGSRDSLVEAGFQGQLCGGGGPRDSLVESLMEKGVPETAWRRGLQRQFGEGWGFREEMDGWWMVLSGCLMVVGGW